MARKVLPVWKLSTSAPNEYLLKLPKGVLANRLAIRAETLSRILKQLSKEGILSVHGNLVRVHSREKLQRLVDEVG